MSIIDESEFRDDWYLLDGDTEVRFGFDTSTGCFRRYIGILIIEVYMLDTRFEGEEITYDR